MGDGGRRAKHMGAYGEGGAAGGSAHARRAIPRPRATPPTSHQAHEPACAHMRLARRTFRMNAWSKAFCNGPKMSHMSEAISRAVRTVPTATTLAWRRGSASLLSKLDSPNTDPSVSRNCQRRDGGPMASARSQAARDQAARDQAARDQAARDQAARDQATSDQAARDQATSDQAARAQATSDQTASDKTVARHVDNQHGEGAARERDGRLRAWQHATGCGERQWHVAAPTSPSPALWHATSPASTT